MSIKRAPRDSHICYVDMLDKNQWSPLVYGYHYSITDFGCQLNNCPKRFSHTTEPIWAYNLIPCDVLLCIYLIHSTAVRSRIWITMLYEQLGYSLPCVHGLNQQLWFFRMIITRMARISYMMLSYIHHKERVVIMVRDQLSIYLFEIFVFTILHSMYNILIFYGLSSLTLLKNLRGAGNPDDGWAYCKACEVTKVSWKSLHLVDIWHIVVSKIISVKLLRICPIIFPTAKFNVTGPYNYNYLSIYHIVLKSNQWLFFFFYYSACILATNSVAMSRKNIF